MNCPRCNTINPDYADSCSRCGTPMPVADTETLAIDDSGSLAIGSQFGPRYRIEGLLGQGGMGRVYKAHDKELGRTVALKVVRPGLVGDTDALARFKQELLLASKISQKHILRIHDMGSVGETRFITMAYVDGRDLHRILKDNPQMPLERVLKFARQLAEALAAAHAEGVVHRDLKPQNMLVDKDDNIYVSDFGLAKSFEEGARGMTKAGALLGTPRYMSPEQVEGTPTDQRSDIYAYGLILYEMLAGDVPFTGESTLKVMYQRIQETPKNPKLVNPDIPDWLIAITMRCLEREAGKRYQSAEEILADLRDGGASGSRSLRIRIPGIAPRKWIWGFEGLAAVLVFAVTLVIVKHWKPSAGNVTPGSADVPPLANGRYIAVLPLQIAGDASQLGYLAEGIEEALSAKLFQLKGVQVSSMDAAGKTDQKQPLPKIAGSLGANLLVLGTLQSSGDKIRIDMRLEDVADGKRLWSKEFEGVSGDLFALEDQIYGQLVAALKINASNEELANAEARPTENLAAYDLYLRGKNSLKGHGDKAAEEALDYFDRALERDPSFALAYAGIADASLRMYITKKDGFWTQRALAAAQHAQQLNDSLPEVHATLASVYRATGRYSESITESKRAISLAPSSDQAFRQLGNIYSENGQGREAIQAYQKAVELNPYYWANHNSLGTAYTELGDYPKALEAFHQVIVLEPDVDTGYENTGAIYLQQNKCQESVSYFQKAIAIEPYFSTYSNLGTAYFCLKQYANAVGMFEKASALNPNDTQVMVNLADAYWGAGQKDKARAVYEQAISLGFKELQTNPQASSVMAQIALSYATIGNGQEAEKFIRRARAIDESNVNYIYDEADIDAKLGRVPEGLKALQEALDRHYPAEAAQADTDMDSLRSRPEFAKMIKDHTAPAAKK